MVNKITSPITPLEEVDKINEIIDDKQDTITSSNKLSASLISGLATVATSGSYNDLSNQPTIPTVNNATLTITQGGTTKGTFTANASSNVTIDLDSGGGSVDVDNKSITTNSSNELQTVGVIDSNNTTNAIKIWTGTKAQYDAIVSKDANTLYNVTDDTDVSLTILEALYPVGSVYITTANTCPLSALISGSTWVQETCRQLVEKKEPTDNDPSWYNLYSDGWCEQGGIKSLSFNNTNGVGDTVNLIKSYINTNYDINICSDNYSGVAGTTNMTVQNSTTISSFGIVVNTLNYQNITTTIQARWQACGYTLETTSHKQFRRTA